MKDCPSCGIQVDIASASCPRCGFPFSSGMGTQTSVLPAKRPKIQASVDVAITIDRTGSSLGFAKGISDSLPMILNPIGAKVASAKVFLQTHGDLDENEEMVLLTNGGTIDQAIQDAQKIVFQGGGDPPEHHLDAIERLEKTVPWLGDPARSRGVIIAFMTADSKEARSKRSPREIGEEIKKKSLLLYLICEPTPKLHELCVAAGGLMFRISNSPNPAEMQLIASQVSASIIAAVNTGGTKPMSVPLA